MQHCAVVPVDAQSAMNSSLVEGSPDAKNRRAPSATVIIDLRGSELGWGCEVQLTGGAGQINDAVDVDLAALRRVECWAERVALLEDWAGGSQDGREGEAEDGGLHFCWGLRIELCSGKKWCASFVAESEEVVADEKKFGLYVDRRAALYAFATSVRSVSLSPYIFASPV